MSKLLYKIVTIMASMLGGVLAGVIFKRVWKVAAREDDAPDATDEERQWREVLAASALQGAIAGLMKALMQRGGATGIRRVTGSWPA